MSINSLELIKIIVSLLQVVPSNQICPCFSNIAGLYPTKSISIVSKERKVPRIRAFLGTSLEKGDLRGAGLTQTELPLLLPNDKNSIEFPCAFQTQLRKFGAVGGNYYEYRKTALTARR